MMTWKDADASRLDLDRIAFLALYLAEGAEELPKYWGKTDEYQSPAVEAMAEGLRSWLFQIWCELQDAARCNDADLSAPPGLVKPADPGDAESEGFFDDALNGMASCELVALERKEGGPVKLPKIAEPLSKIVGIAQDLNDRWGSLNRSQRKQRLDEAMRLAELVAEVVHQL